MMYKYIYGTDCQYLVSTSEEAWDLRVLAGFLESHLKEMILHIMGDVQSDVPMVTRVTTMLSAVSHLLT